MVHAALLARGACVRLGACDSFTTATRPTEVPRPAARPQPAQSCPVALGIFFAAGAAPRRAGGAPAAGRRARGAVSAVGGTEASPAEQDAAQLVAEVADGLGPSFGKVDALVGRNLRRVQGAFFRAGVASHFFGGSTGYGHDDLGREALDQVYSEVFGCEAAVVRPHFQSGTHAIACALFGALRPGDELVALAGHPYDTMEEVIGLRGEPDIGSLADLGVAYREVALGADGGIDWGSEPSWLSERTACVLIQRSCGYAMRKSLSVEEIGRAVGMIKARSPRCTVVVDNCYGEFVEDSEPGHVGADLVAGSLIKNPGGTIAPCGGYVAGTRGLVARAAARLSAPGVGQDSGAVPGDWLRLMFQGMWLAPATVGEAIKGGNLVAAVLAARGFTVTPPPGTARADIITAAELGSAGRLLAFCRAVQRCSPVGAHIQPVPGATPGYASEVVFADGTFIDGSTSELSADGPLREPYAVYCQGGTHWTHWAWVLEEALQDMDAAEG